MSDIQFRSATEADIPTIILFSRMLAEHQGNPEKVIISEDALADLLFGPKAIGYAYIAERNAEAVGVAVLMQKFSSYSGKRILYIEDLVVAPEARGFGVGTLMMQFLSKVALDMGCNAMEWYAHKEDKSALRFYERLGAQYDEPHVIFGFDEGDLSRMAGAKNE